ncbi:MHYT domain-containing protein [Flavisphingomonas formosensis]|uniref:MHYT domain-containing protein n=1 Tax=Flavisphingomonas formosensis TaxID=861534 RepID=UPI0018E0227F|nr:MHYT domain-containing protein [Sphingomonas formosensis]
MVISGVHDGVLVGISILIAIMASYTALDLAGRIRASQGRARRLWLITAAIAMGGGIWAMHFVAMLALRLPGMEMNYDLSLTFLSAVVAILVTGAGFAMMSEARRSPIRLAAAGLIMGLGIVAMHYIGMAAMKMSGLDLHYDPAWVTLSVVIAIGAATGALWLASRSSRQMERISAAALMGFAIAGMHYAGMQGALFLAHPGMAMIHDSGGVGQTALATAVSATTFLILFLSLVAAMFDRRFALLAQREAEGLRRSEERFRALYRGTPLPLHSLDADGRIEHVSETWLQLLGYSYEEVVGKHLIRFLTKESARLALTRDWPDLLRAGRITPREYRAVAKDGQLLDVVSAAEVERDADGTLHILGGLTDITERKRTEEALRQSQKIEAIGQLTGGVAHDFNNLLAVVIGNLDLLRKHVPDDEPKAQRFLASAMEGAQRGAALTQRLLAFARRQDLRPEPVDVPQLVRGMADMLQRSLGPRIRVETHFPLSLRPAQADAHQLELAILNLAVNARDAMPNGGTLSIAADAQMLLPGNSEGLAAGIYIHLTLTDDGIGMDAQTLARASEPFFTTKGVGKGTGLGLPMVQGLAAQSGGRLALRSEPGVGTSVELWLPVAQNLIEPRPAAAPSRRDMARLRPRSILVVDDDPLVLANTVAMLEDLGHQPVPATSGPEALDRLQSDIQVDLVISDQLMPAMTGTELADRIRSNRPSLPILLVSGFAEFGVEDRKDLPMLRKPFDQRQLADAIADVSTSAAILPMRFRRT